MRQTQAAPAIASIVTVLAILGVTVINAKPAKELAAAPAASSIDVMQMMSDAKGLPAQQFDAY